MRPQIKPASQPAMRRLTPRRSMHFAFVQMTKTLALVFGIEHAVFDQLVQPELNRVLDDTKDTVPLIVFVDAQHPRSTRVGCRRSARTRDGHRCNAAERSSLRSGQNRARIIARLQSRRTWRMVCSEKLTCSCLGAHRRLLQNPRTGIILPLSYYCRSNSERHVQMERICQLRRENFSSHFAHFGAVP